MDHISMAYFLRVCELHNFTKAAESLHISQPALSRRIIALENELGVKLLDRSNNIIQLTDGGKLFYDEAKRIIDRETMLKEKMVQYKCGSYGKIKIGYDPHAFIEPIIYATQLMRELHPEIELEFVEMSNRYAVYSFLHNEIDMIYVYREELQNVGGAKVEVIVKNQPVALIPKGHRLWGWNAVSCSDLIGEQFALAKPNTLSKPVIRSFKQKGLSFEGALFCAYPSTRLFYIASGKCIGLAGAYSPENLGFSEYIQSIRIADVSADAVDCCIAYRPDNVNSAQMANCMLLFKNKE